jgi:hypothetical protein
MIDGKSTGRLPVGQLTPRNVPQPQEFQPDLPQEASPEEEPFEIELVVPKSPTAQDSPAEEQQPEDHGTEEKTDEEQPPPSDTEPEKMYRDADKVESFGAESPILAVKLRALLEHLGITIAPRYKIKEVPRPRRVEFKAIAEIFFGSRIFCRHKGLWGEKGYPPELGPLPSTLPEEGSIQGLWGEKGYPPDGDGTTPGCGSGAEHSPADRSTQD